MIAAVETYWTDTQKKLIAITPKCTSSLSIIGSSYIIYHCITSNSTSNRNSNSSTVKAKGRGFQSTVYNRILMALSFCDLISSLAWFLSTWPIPKDDDQGISIYNIGNQYSCNLQGFMLQFAFLGGALYNTCLSVYFCLLVHAKINGKKNNSNSTTSNEDRRKPQRHNRKTTELIFHFVSLVFPLSTAIYGISKGFVNPTPSNCYFADFPRGCVGEECIRGQGYTKIRLLFLLMPIVICFLVIFISMFVLHRSVKKLERQTLKRATSAVVVVRASNKESSNNMVKKTSNFRENEIKLNSTNDGDDDDDDDDAKPTDVGADEENIQSSTSRTSDPHKNILISQASKKVLSLAVRYIAAFLSVWVPVVFQTIITKVFVNDVQVSFWSHLILEIFGPLQGFFNALIYRGFNPIRFLCETVFSTCCVLLGRARRETYSSESWSYEYYDDEDW